MSLTQQARRMRPAMAGGMEQVSSWSRDIRFASGMVLLLFAATHFFNHAAGIFGVGAMEEAQRWRAWLWHSMPGTVALYLSLVVHPFFALLRVAQRRTFKMPAREMMQIALGLAIPIFLIDHIVGTRVMGSLFGQDESYTAVLRRLWPGLAASQALLLLLVWVHGMIGVHFWLRGREGWARWRDPFFLFAIILPVLSLIGFMVAGREAAAMAMPPETVTAGQVAMFNHNVMVAKTSFFGIVAGFVGFVVFREVRVRTARQISVRFVGHGVRKLTPGPTVLEMFRRFGIPHAALCGGRARCATCRVLVLDGGEELPPPAPNEAKLLRRIAAPDRVRLACQIRPRTDLQVQILLASRLQRPASGQVEIDESIARRGLTVMVADLRAFSTLAERQLPHELIGLLNRFFDEMAQAVAAHEGRIEALYGDGFMAVFGMEASPAAAARGAIAAAGDIVLAVEALNREFGQALPLPLRIGIGIHSGQTIVGAVENDALGRHEITIGETVMIASQMESATRRVLADIVVSEDAVRATGRRYRGTTSVKVAIKGRDKPLGAFGFASAPAVATDDDEAMEAPVSPVQPVAVTDTGDEREPGAQAETGDAMSPPENGLPPPAPPRPVDEAEPQPAETDDRAAAPRRRRPRRKPSEAGA